MSRTRQHRIQDPAAIRKAIGSSVGKMLHVVMKDDRVMIGKLERAVENTLTISNMRQKSMTLDVTQISEIYIDRLD